LAKIEPAKDTFVKICGITRLADALAAERSGANAIGFVFAPSPRRIAAEQAGEIALRVHPSVLKVGVFVNESLDSIVSHREAVRLDAVQLHGNETGLFIEKLRSALPSTMVFKAVRALKVADVASLRQTQADVILFDPKDTSDPSRRFEPIPLNWFSGTTAFRYVISGGLTPDNVGGVVSKIKPWGVDVSSGVESSPGQKDPSKIKAFMDAVRRAEEGP